jgi:CRISPR-associated protein Cmr4
MKSYLYKIECLTNLHVGSGDANYSIVDNEVEKDEVLGSPVIHASGVKGALRDFAETSGITNIVEIFGSPAENKISAKPFV